MRDNASSPPQKQPGPFRTSAQAKGSLFEADGDGAWDFPEGKRSLVQIHHGPRADRRIGSPGRRAAGLTGRSGIAQCGACPACEPARLRCLQLGPDGPVSVTAVGGTL
jgi:hypothetical protein